jgi:hypothetical protein
MLAGNVVALLSPLVTIPILTLIFGWDHYDWASMQAIRKGDDHDIADSAGVDIETVPGERQHSHDAARAAAEEEAEQKLLLRAGRISKSVTAFMTISFLVLWPMPMYGSGYVFSKPFFTGWVTVGIIWIFCSLFAVGVFPVFQGRKTLVGMARSIFLDITGKQHPKTIQAQNAAATGEENEGSFGKGSGDVTPPEKADNGSKGDGEVVTQ